MKGMGVSDQKGGTGGEKQEGNFLNPPYKRSKESSIKTEIIILNSPNGTGPPSNYWGEPASGSETGKVHVYFQLMDLELLAAGGVYRLWADGFRLT